MNSEFVTLLVGETFGGRAEHKNQALGSRPGPNSEPTG